MLGEVCLQLKMRHTRSATLCLGFGHVSHYEIGNPHIGHELIPYSLRARPSPYMILQYPTWLYRLTISNPTLDSCTLYTWHLQQPTVRPKARFRSSTGASMCMAALQPVACFFFSACIAAQTTRGIPKNMDLLGKPLVMWMSFLANKSSNVISQQISTCKKGLSTIGLAPLQKNIEHHYILQDFLAFNHPPVIP